MEKFQRKEHKENNNNLQDIENKLLLNKKDQQLLADLLILNQRLEEVYFSSESSIYTNMINDIIEKKLKDIDPFTAYKMLNHLYRADITNAYPGTIIKIINNIDCDLPKERVSSLLLKIVLKSNNYINFLQIGYTGGFISNVSNNMLNFLIAESNILNYYFILDTIELFLGLITDDEIISNNIKETIKKRLLFIYNDLDIELKNFKLNYPNMKLIANRFDTAQKTTLGFIHQELKEKISYTQFLSEADMLLKMEDDKIDDPSILIIGEHYLNCISDNISNKTFKELLNEYNDLEQSLSLENHTEALNYVYESVNRKTKSKKKKL